MGQWDRYCLVHQLGQMLMSHLSGKLMRRQSVNVEADAHTRVHTHTRTPYQDSGSEGDYLIERSLLSRFRVYNLNNRFEKKLILG